MKNFKHIIFCAGLILLNSCQNEATETEEELSETNLIDQTYAEDLIFYKDATILFENSEHTIEEVLTDATLFDYYANAYSHHFHEKENTSILYVTPKDSERATEMIAGIEDKIAAGIEENSRSEKTTANLQYNFTAKFHKNTNFDGDYYEWYKEGNALSSDNKTIKRNINLPSWISNEVSSVRWSKTIDSDISQGILIVYSDDDLKGTTSIFNAAVNVSSLNNWNVGNDNIESVAFRVTAK